MSKKIVVAGAGIGGLCVALALSKRGFYVEVFEQSGQLAEVGAGLQLSPNAMHVLAALQVAKEVKAKAFMPDSAVMRHYQSGKAYFTVPLAATAVKKYAAEYLHIHRADLHQVLYQACLAHGVTVYLGQAVQGYQQDGQNLRVLVNEQASIKADALIGADGIKSKVQACMLGQTPARFTGQVAWRGVIEAKYLPVGLIQPKANLWVGPGQHFVSYYLRGGDLLNFVAVQERKDWQSESWEQKGNLAELQTAFNSWHPEVSQLLAATQQSFLWALYDRPPLNRWTDGNVALLGDACHPMLPFLAQGAAMAIEDSYALAHCLANEHTISQALRRYQDIRLARTSKIQQNAANNAPLYHMSSAAQKAKLSVLSGLSSLGLSNPIAAKKLDAIYAYNIVKELNG